MPGEFELRKEVSLEATPEQVWEAIATGPGLAAWFMPMDVDPGAASVLGWEPGKRLAIQTPTAEDGSFHAFEYLIEAREGGSTVLRFVHSGFASDEWGAEFEAMTSQGWDMYLHTLGQYLKHFLGRRASYVGAEGPPSSAEPGGWPVLLGALGLPRSGSSVSQGDQVQLTPAGLAPIDGVVDYLTPNFLGVRTSDALFRFHGRAALGMSIAVGHHLYTADVDGAEAAASWQSWLDAVFA